MFFIFIIVKLIFFFELGIISKSLRLPTITTLFVTRKDYYEKNISSTTRAILREEFMEPFDLSTYKLMQAMLFPLSRIQDIFMAGER